MTKRFDQSFRNEAIRLALTGDKSIAQTAKDLGIKEPTLYNWINQAKKGKSTIIKGDENLTAAQIVDELNRLRKENARLKEEREILKKAAVFFAKEEQKR
jgi:transposase